MANYLKAHFIVLGPRLSSILEDLIIWENGIITLQIVMKAM